MSIQAAVLVSIVVEAAGVLFGYTLAVWFHDRQWGPHESD